MDNEANEVVQKKETHLYNGFTLLYESYMHTIYIAYIYTVRGVLDGFLNFNLIEHTKYARYQKKDPTLLYITLGPFFVTFRHLF